MPRDPDRPPPKAPDPPGRVLLGRYRIEGTLGRGGMGEVLLAWDLLLGRQVALKHLPADREAPEKRRAAVIREARRACRITHPRVAAIHDVIEEGDDVLLVMERISGVTLRERLESQGPLSLEAFWHIAAQCAEGLAAAHAQGVVHRDIKPENLMLTEDGQIKILDFGVARHSASFLTSATTQTAPDLEDIAGTPAYMAPEAHLGAPPDERSDLFSLGVVYYELLTGRRPFAAPSYAGVVDRVMHSHPAPVAELNPRAGRALSDLVEELLAKEPQARMPSATTLLLRLRAARGAGDAADPPKAKRLATPARPRSFQRPRAAMWTASLAVVASGAVGAWIVLRPPPLPTGIQLAVLPPETPVAGRDEDFRGFALGLAELLDAQLRREVAQPGFQMASFQEGYEQNVRSAADARKVLGVNLALATTLERTPDALRARLELVETGGGRVLRRFAITGPASEPFEFIRRLHRDAMHALGRSPGTGAAPLGMTGAGTLRFWLQGSGRIRAAADTAAIRAAIEDLELACRTEPTSPAARSRLSLAWLKAYNLDHAGASLERADAAAHDAAALDSTFAESYRALGLTLAARKDNEGALAALERARRLDPTDDDVCLRRARLFGRLGRKAEELEAYLETIRERPHCWQPYWWLATWYFREGRVDEAIGAYERMIERAPLLYKGYSSLGGVLVLRGEYARATDLLRRSVALYPTKVAFDNLGSACFISRRLEDAIAAYNQSFQFGFADYESWLNLGDAYFWLQKRRDLAGQAYAQAVTMARAELVERGRSGRSADPMIQANLATVFPKLGQPDSARVYLGRIIEAGGTNPMVACCAALTMWQLGDRPAAVEWLDRSVRNGYPIAWLRDSPVFDEWRGESRFEAILANASAPEAVTPGKGGS